MNLSAPPENLDRFDILGFDTETTGLNWPVDSLFSYSIAFPDGSDAYVDIRHDEEGHEFWKEWLSHDYKGLWVAHNLAFDYKMAWSAGIVLPIPQGRDTVILANILNEFEREYSLDYLSNKFLGMSKIPIWEMLAEKYGGRPTKKTQMKNLKNLPPEEAAPYGVEDAKLCLELYHVLWRNLEEADLLPIWELEQEAMPRFIEAEMCGIRVDLGLAERAADELTPLIEEHQASLSFLAGEDFNPNSSPQMRKFFKPKQESNGEWYVDGVMLEKTKKGQPSLGASALRDLAAAGSLVAQNVLEIRSLLKTRDTFLRGHVLGHAVGDRVYPNINQMKTDHAAGTGTGRLSYTNPGMQQIPNRNKAVAAIVKPVFLPDEDQIWVDSDMSSFEVRVFAHLVNDPEICRQYRENPELDFHQFVATLTNLVRDATYSGEPNAKQLNLSMIFTQGEGATAEKMGMDWTWEEFKEKGTGKLVRYKKPGLEAQKIIARYHNRIPGIKRLADREKRNALRHGYIETEFGRRCRFPRGLKAYKASGIKIQATSADLNKMNWINSAVVKSYGGRMILNTHDSYSFSMPRDTWMEGFARFKSLVEGDRKLNVPLLLELSGTGDNWWEAISGDHDAELKGFERYRSDGKAA